MAVTRLPLAERVGKHDLHAFVALDTIDLLADHLTAIVGTGRRFSVFDQYVGDKPLSLWETGYRAKTSLYLSQETRYESGIHRWEQRCFPAGKGITFHCDPGIVAWGISAYDLAREKHNRTEDAAAAYYHSRTERRTNVTLVRVDGWPSHPARSDRIFIEHWNEHGVCQETLVMFEEHR